MAEITLINGDCLVEMTKLAEKSVDIVVTSPPYNIEIKYASYKDNKTNKEYLEWTNKWITLVNKVLKDDGSFFLNISGSLRSPWVPYEVAIQTRNTFCLQNEIIWVKSIHIDSVGHTYGHVKPFRTNRFLNGTHQFVFHFTKTGDVPVRRYDEGVGVPFSDESNITRWKHGRERACGGSTWHIPHKTINNKDIRGRHPAVFPVELPEKCIRLHGFNEETVVLDPFGGIGTTAMACKKLNVNCVSIELDKEYYQVAQDKISHTP